jgi:hypothetical protein
MSPGCCAPAEPHPVASSSSKAFEKPALGCDDGDSCCAGENDTDNESDCCAAEKECKGDDDCCEPTADDDDDCASACCAGGNDEPDDCCSGGDVAHSKDEKVQVKITGGCDGCASGEKEACNGSLDSPFQTKPAP